MRGVLAFYFWRLGVFVDGCEMDFLFAYSGFWQASKAKHNIFC